MIAPTPYNRVKYELKHAHAGTLSIPEPIGWKDDQKEYARVSGEFEGVVMQFSNSLTFVLNGADFITMVRDNYGEETDLMLIKYEKHPITDIESISYFGYLDLYSYSRQDNKVQCKITSGSLAEILKNRINEDVEIERTESIDGLPLQPLNIKLLDIEGRRIFLRSTLEDNSKKYLVDTFGLYHTGHGLNCFPQKKIIDSDENIVETFPNFNTDGFEVPYTNTNPPTIEPQNTQFFYFRNDRNKVIKIKIDFEAIMTFQYANPQNQFVKFYLQKSLYQEDADATPLQTIHLGSVYGNGIKNEFQTIKWDNLNNGYEITIEEDECLCFFIETPQGFNSGLGVRFTIQKNNIEVTEHSVFEPTTTKMIMAYELGERLVEIITGKRDLFYSKSMGRKNDINYPPYEFQEDGFASMVAFAHGHWIRNFSKEEPEEDNRYKSLTFSLQKFVETMSTIWGLSLGIEKIGNSERVIIEPRDYFYVPQVTIKLKNRVKNLKRTVATEYCYNSIEIGYEKGGEYEEAQGLDEYNALSRFTLPLKKVKNVYTKVSPARTDSYGCEFARRKQIDRYPVTDTRYDQDVFAFDVRRLVETYEYPAFMKLRRWWDDYLEAPTGTYSPGTAFNLRFSPFSLLRRHLSDLSPCLYKYQSEAIRYASSTANSNLGLKEIISVTPPVVDEYTETSNIPVSQLPTPVFLPEWIEFQHEVGFEEIEQIEGFTMIEGNKVPNFYGLVQFEDETGSTHFGFLFSVKPNNAGDWKVLTVNRKL